MTDLRLPNPVLDASPDPELEKANHYTWNLRVNVVVEFLWGLGLALISATTIVPIFLAKLGASNRVIALVPGITLVGFALLQLPSAYFTTRLRHKTRPAIYIHLPYVGAWLAAALIAQFLAVPRPDTSRLLFLLCLGVASLSGGIGMPLWTDFMNRQTPARSRGRFFGWTFAAGSAAGLLGGLIARRVIGQLGHPTGFATCFYIAGAVMFAGLMPYFLVREVVAEPVRFASLSAFGAHLRDVLTRRGNLRRLLFVRCIMEAGMMSSAFYAVRALQAGGFPDSAAGTFVIVATAGQVPAMLLAGYLGEHYGFRTLMAAGGLLAAIATALAFAGAAPGWFYALFLCSGCAFACDLVSTINLVMEMSPELDKTVYQAAYGTLLVPIRIAYPLLAGWLAERFAVPTVFAVTFPLQIVGALAALFVIRDTGGHRRL